MQAWLRMLLAYPTTAADLPEWLSSRLRGGNALEAGVPWVSYPARRWLERHLRPDWHVFEFGAGGSTLFFSERVKSVISVEHDEAWHARVAALLTHRGRGNVDLRWVPPGPLAPEEDPDAYGPSHYTSRAREGRYRGLQFREYVGTIDRLAPRRFDLVFVDGRSRPACARHALRHVRPGGWLLLDNSDKPRYAPVLELLGAYPRTDLAGVGPFEATPWRTSAWQVP
jgi:hypothetical protein